MSDYWKLDINEYTLTELKDLFGLKEPHTLEDIVNADNTLNERIKMDKSIDDNKKKQILEFLSKAKEKLIAEQKIDMAHLVTTHVHPGDGHMTQKLPPKPPHLHRKFIPGAAAGVYSIEGMPKPVFKKVLAKSRKYIFQNYRKQILSKIINERF